MTRKATTKKKRRKTIQLLLKRQRRILETVVHLLILLRAPPINNPKVVAIIIREKPTPVNKRTVVNLVIPVNNRTEVNLVINLAVLLEDSKVGSARAPLDRAAGQLAAKAEEAVLPVAHSNREVRMLEVAMVSQLVANKKVEQVALLVPVPVVQKEDSNNSKAKVAA